MRQGREVVRILVFGYPRRVTVRSPLDTLEQLRRQVHEAEKARLAAQAEAARAAAAERERARQVLLAATARDEAARRDEDMRLGERGVTAAEGQRRVVWEAAQRQARAALWDEHERAVESHRAAALEHERAQQTLARADAELRLIQERIERRERARRLGEEAAQQELLDEASLRRFAERGGA
jgi:hypothetical protein